MSTPPPIPSSTTNWDVLPVRLAVLALSAAILYLAVLSANTPR